MRLDRPDDMYPRGLRIVGENSSPPQSVETPDFGLGESGEEFDIAGEVRAQLDAVDSGALSPKERQLWADVKRAISSRQGLTTDDMYVFLGINDLAVAPSNPQSVRLIHSYLQSAGTSDLLINVTLSHLRVSPPALPRHTDYVPADLDEWLALQDALGAQIVETVRPQLHLEPRLPRTRGTPTDDVRLEFDLAGESGEGM
ncbi:hypothetical protein KBD59_04160 [Candidatus Gracilibacteria bacterium]|nr:hypothetical protein [Candidatus Gracilibacteria bacterium]